MCVSITHYIELLCKYGPIKVLGWTNCAIVMSTIICYGPLCAALLITFVNFSWVNKWGADKPIDDDQQEQQQEEEDDDDKDIGAYLLLVGKHCDIVNNCGRINSYCCLYDYLVPAPPSRRPLNGKRDVGGACRRRSRCSFVRRDCDKFVIIITALKSQIKNVSITTG